MKAYCSTVALLAILLLLPISAVAQTQSEMDSNSCSDYKKTDRKLNAVYRQILRKKKGDANFVAAFRKAERAWIAFRNAEIDAIFPGEDKRGQYGSVYPMCHCDALNELTEQRVRELSAWLTTPEGAVCAGSQWP